jgi:hypothetical protein
MRLTFVSAVVFVGGLGQPVAAQVGTNDITVRLAGRVQAQFNTTDIDPSEAGFFLPASTFETRRIRLTGQITIRDWITGIIEPDYALGVLQLRLAFVNFAFTNAVQLKAGQFKKPFSRIFLESSTQIPAIERGLRIRGLPEALEVEDTAGGQTPILVEVGGIPLVGEEQFILETIGYLGYDIGASLNGVVGPLRYEAGVFNGAGADRRDDNDGKTYGLRVSGNPSGKVPLLLGAAVLHQSKFSTPESGTAFELFGEWSTFRTPGLHVLAELASGGTLVVDDAFTVAQVVAAWFMPFVGRVEGMEPVARVSYGNPRHDIADDAGLLISPGFNLYFFGRNRLSLNWDVWLPQGDRFESSNALRAQAQLAF